MGVYTSKMRYTGTSGVDVESMVQSLMQAEGMKADKLYKQKTKLEWQQQSMRTMGLSVRGFRDNYLSFSSTSTIFNMRSASNFSARSVSGTFSGGGAMSNGASSSVISLGGNSSITATPDLPAGDYTVKVEGVAASEKFTGTKQPQTSTSSTALDFDAANIEAGDFIDMTVNGTTKRLTFTKEELDVIKEVDESTDSKAKEKEFATLVQKKIDATFGKLGDEQKVKVSIDGDGKLQFEANENIGSTFTIKQDSAMSNVTSVTSTNNLAERTYEYGTSTVETNGTVTYSFGGESVNKAALPADADGATKDQYLSELNASLASAGATARFDNSGKIVIKGNTPVSQGMYEYGTQTSNGDGTITYKIGSSSVQMDELKADATSAERTQYLKDLNTKLTDAGAKATATFDEDGKIQIKSNGFKDAGTHTYTVDGKTINVNYASGGTTSEYLTELNKGLQEKGIKASASLNAEGKLVFKPTDGSKDISISSSSIGLDGTTLKANSSAISKIGFSTTDLTSSFDVNKKMGYTAKETISFGGTTFDVDENTTYKDFMDKVNATGKATMTFSSVSNAFSIESKTMGAAGKIDFGDATNDFAKFNIDTTKAPSVDATDAKVTIVNPDGTEQIIMRESNTFSYNGMNFKLDPSLQSKIKENKGVIEAKISVSANTTQVYDNIKQFVDSYNAMVDALSTATRQKPAKSDSYTGYDPLTDEEKAAMSDDQVEQYEAKAKEGLLYRNPEYERLQSKMREAMNSQVTLADGSKISLASIGITTGEYTNGGKLFNDEQKLRTALKDNPDGVAAVFTDSKNGVAEKLNKAIEEAVGTNGYVTTKAGFEDSVYVENNYYSKLIKSKEEDLNDLYEYLAEKENYYYSMFAAMENAINQSNSDMATLSSYS